MKRHLRKLNWDKMLHDQLLPCTDNEIQKKCVTAMEPLQRKYGEVCLQLLLAGLRVHQQVKGGQLFLDTR